MTNRKRIANWLFYITLFLFVVIIWRFYAIMSDGVINGVDLTKNVNNQYANAGVIKADRGKIFDADNQPIASDASAYTLFAVLTDAWSDDAENPQHVVDTHKTAETLAKYIAMSPEDIEKNLNNQDASQVEFGSAGHQLTLETKKAIEAEKLPGIFFRDEPIRFYPNGIFASHVVGFAQVVDENDKNLVGVLGLEAQFNDILSGKDGSYARQVDKSGYIIPNSKQEREEAVEGDDLYLTLDHSLQSYMESVVEKVNRENPSEAITANLMEAETGRILASTQRPTFNASTKENIDATWQTFLSEYSYEPGSTMKVMSLAAAIQAGVFEPNRYVETGSIKVGGGTVNDVKPKGWGSISEIEGVARSSNTLFVRLFNAMGEEKWGDYLTAFGFAQPTGIELPNEAAGSNPFNSTLQQANTSFGQGISVTPVQMLQAFSAIANDGKMVKPHLVDKIVDNESGKETAFSTEIVGQPISAETAQQTLQYLFKASQYKEATTAPFIIDNYDAALKTGTAEVVNAETGLYSYSDKIYSVVGMAPLDDPKYILYITVKNPQLKEGYVHGSQVTRDIYTPIMKWALDRSAEGEVATAEEAITTPKVTDTSLNEGQQQLEDLGYDVTVIGSGNRIVQQSPMPGEQTSKGQHVILMTNGAMSIPDLTGWSKNDALKVAEMTGIHFEFKGEGYVVDQTVDPNQHVELGQTVEFTLSKSEN